jgi:hypothetical protein
MGSNAMPQIGDHSNGSVDARGTWLAMKTKEVSMFKEDVPVKRSAA